MEIKTKLTKDKLKKPLQDREDYTDFVKSFMYSESGQLVRFSFDIWQTLKTVADLIAPFSFIFIQDKRLRQAFELLHSVLKEKKAELNQLQVKASEKQKYGKQLDNMISNLEHYLSETGLSINDVSKKDLHKLFREAK